MLFAPAFSDFGCDVAREFLSRSGGGAVYGLCTGPELIKKEVEANLGHLCGRLWWLHEEEEKWLSTPASLDALERLEQDLGPGAFGRIVVADRRVGLGFVSGGMTRPDPIGRRAVASPNQVPQRYVLGLYRFLSQVLEETRPDSVFCYAVAGAPAVALAEICQSRNIAFTRLIAARIGNRYMVDDDPAGRELPVARRLARLKEGIDHLKLSDQETAHELLETFRQNPTAPEYARRIHALLRSQTLFRVAARASFGILKELAKGMSRPKESIFNVSRGLFQIETAWRRASHKSKYFSSLSSIKSEFIYFPLQVDPEASTMVLSPLAHGSTCRHRGSGQECASAYERRRQGTCAYARASPAGILRTDRQNAASHSSEL